MSQVTPLGIISVESKLKSFEWDAVQFDVNKSTITHKLKLTEVYEVFFSKMSGWKICMYHSFECFEKHRYPNKAVFSFISIESFIFSS